MRNERGITAGYFDISPKTTHRNLAEARKKNTKALHPVIADEIVQNARELTTSFCSREVFDEVATIVNFNAKRKKEKVLQGSALMIAPTVAGIMVAAEWNMDNAEVVYMSGFYLARAIGDRLNFLNSQKQQYESHQRQFISREKERETIEKERKNINALSIFCPQLKKILWDYADRYLSTDEGYLEVLRSLPYLTDTRVRGQGFGINKILQLFKRGNISEAHELLENTGAIAQL